MHHTTEIKTKATEVKVIYPLRQTSYQFSSFHFIFMRMHPEHCLKKKKKIYIIEFFWNPKKNLVQILILMDWKSFKCGFVSDDFDQCQC